MEAGIERLVEFRQRVRQIPVPAVAVGRFHHHDVGALRRIGIAQQRAAGIADVAGKHDDAPRPVLLRLQLDARRAEDVAGIEEGCLQPRREFDRLSVAGLTAEAVEDAQRVDQRVKRLDPVGGQTAPLGDPQVATVLLFLEMRGVEQHDPRQIARRRCGDDLATKAALHQHRDPAAMVEMGVGQQQNVDRGGVEAEILGVGRLQPAAALVEAAIDENPFACGFEQMAGAGDGAVGAVER